MSLNPCTCVWLYYRFVDILALIHEWLVIFSLDIKSFHCGYYSFVWLIGLLYSGLWHQLSHHKLPLWRDAETQAYRFYCAVHGGKNSLNLITSFSLRLDCLLEYVPWTFNYLMWVNFAHGNRFTQFLDSFKLFHS